MSKKTLGLDFGIAACEAFGIDPSDCLAYRIDRQANGATTVTFEMALTEDAANDLQIAIETAVLVDPEELAALLERAGDSDEAALVRALTKVARDQAAQAARDRNNKEQ